ncbi:hypothetical protein ASPFODRAFT_201212 [Aspergillus luchuensis CBS 106.47]|uniref:Asp-hemolysin n=1 Tax=Aspergillus luchuensis (strain CBS 106.47) TaxID=1137211 RepID=A0A1M3SYZ1_ASPLC|nr:hypothetical protein ASPFODRAFT_201212 [Aspergillus luchuensis CBS 106.47]
MALDHSQWVTVHLINSMPSDTLSIQNARLSYGKWYDGDMDHEIPDSAVDGKTAAPGGSVDISSCGRKGSPSGTTGGFDVCDGNTKIGRVQWNCPWGSLDNEFGVSDTNKNYWVQIGSWGKHGAIGTVDVEIGKKS